MTVLESEFMHKLPMEVKKLREANEEISRTLTTIAEALSKPSVKPEKKMIYNDNSSQIAEDIKYFLFEDETKTVSNMNGFEHGLTFESWIGDEHSFIVNDCDGTKYRITVTKEA